MPTAPARLLASLQVLHCFACSTSASDTHRLARPHAQIAYPPYPSFRKVLISSALLKGNRSSPLHSAQATFRRLGFSHLGTLANVTSAFMPTAPARLLASLQVLHCFACSTSASDTHRLARPHAQIAYPPYPSFRKVLISSALLKGNRSSPLLSAKAAFRRLGFSHLGTLRQCVFRFYAHRAGETVGIFAGAALLRMQYICCRYPQTRSPPRTDGLRPATFFQKVALALALLRESGHGQQPETVPFP